MAAFTLDTSGRVLALPGAPHAAPAYCWTDLDAFTRGYIEALFTDYQARVHGDANAGLAFSDLAPEAIAAILKDCAALQGAHPMKPFHNYRRARGAAFWAARTSGRRTSDYAPIYFPPLTPYLGDDGRVYLREAA